MTDRRTFLRGASVLLGSASLSSVMAAFAAAPHKATFFSLGEMRTLLALVDVILPATDSPAASAADTHFFIDLAIPNCATLAAQKTFREGLAKLGDGFVSLAPAAQVAQLKAQAAKDLPLPYEQSFFKILKDYTLTGYFLSEIGATQALAYERVPGGFQGDLPLTPNQKAWAI
jgi:Gluconate 2-dehydrogenase subunit 3